MVPSIIILITIMSVVTIMIIATLLEENESVTIATMKKFPFLMMVSIATHLTKVIDVAMIVLDILFVNQKCRLYPPTSSPSTKLN